MPGYRRTTGSFEIQIADDYQFDLMIAEQSSGLEVGIDEIAGGLVNGILIESSNLYVQDEF